MVFLCVILTTCIYITIIPCFYPRRQQILRRYYYGSGSRVALHLERRRSACFREGVTRGERPPWGIVSIIRVIEIVATFIMSIMRGVTWNGLSLVSVIFPGARQEWHGVLLARTTSLTESTRRGGRRSAGTRRSWHGVRVDTNDGSCWTFCLLSALHYGTI